MDAVVMPGWYTQSGDTGPHADTLGELDLGIKKDPLPQPEGQERGSDSIWED